jgi:hypothetical protein
MVKLNWKRYFFSIQAPRCALILLLVAGAACSGQAPGQVKVTPVQKTSTRLLLPAANDERRQQVDHYASDGFTKQSSEIEYRNGVSESLRYWDNGLRSESIKLYPASRSDLAQGRRFRQVRSRAKYERDGKTFVSHELYRPDGTLERTGKKTAGGDYETRYFFDDGITIERVRIFDARKRFLREKLYRRNATLQAEVSQSGPELHIVIYDTREVRTASYYSSIAGGDHGEVYASDGKTIHVMFSRDRMILLADYYDDQGVLVQHSMKVAGVLTLSAIDRYGIFRQEWRDHRGLDKVVRSTLSVVDELGLDRKLIRTIEMSSDGSHPIAITYPLAGGKKRVHKIASMAREHFYPGRFAMPGRDPLPSFNDFGPARIYDHEDRELKIN